ncbi:MAG: biopolymer transporter ExbD [Pseudomonadota bacterium]
MRERAGIFAKRRARGDEDERILPLINIVFLLLIFFMVVGRLSAADPFEIVPPRSESAGQPPNEPLLVSIGAEGQLALNGRLMEEAALIAEVTAARAGAEAAELRIKSDGRVSAIRVVALLERLRAEGVTSVRLMTVPAERGASPGVPEDRG